MSISPPFHDFALAVLSSNDIHLVGTLFPHGEGLFIPCSANLMAASWVSLPVLYLLVEILSASSELSQDIVCIPFVGLRLLTVCNSYLHACLTPFTKT